MLFGHLSDLATMPEMNPALRHAMEKALALDPHHSHRAAIKLMVRRCL